MKGTGQKDKITFETKKEQPEKKSFFSCCGCGDKETKKEAYVEIKDKQPDQTLITNYQLRTTAPAPLQTYPRPMSVNQVRRTSVVKPKINFTYTSPTPEQVIEFSSRIVERPNSVYVPHSDVKTIQKTSNQSHYVSSITKSEYKPAETSEPKKQTA